MRQERTDRMQHLHALHRRVGRSLCFMAHDKSTGARSGSAGVLLQQGTQARCTARKEQNSHLESLCLRFGRDRSGAVRDEVRLHPNCCQLRIDARCEHALHNAACHGWCSSGSVPYCWYGAGVATTLVCLRRREMLSGRSTIVDVVLCNAHTCLHLKSN